MPIISGSAGGGAGGLKSLYTSTLASPAASIDTGAGGIASGHGTLIVVFCGHTSGAGTDVGVNITVNNDSSALYDLQQIQGANATATASLAQAQTHWGLDLIGTNASDSYSSTIELTIPLYDQTTFWKSGWGGASLPYSQSTAQHVGLYAIGYRATTAISRLAVAAVTGNLVTGSSLTVYGTQ